MGFDEFEKYRRLLEGIAYRMCGVLADAQDIVQETHVRWVEADRKSIRDPRNWLITVCSRQAIDMMRLARVRREEYIGIWLPEPFVESELNDPSKIAEVDDSVSIALMVAMDKLTPTERAAFLLHDVFAYRFEEIALILGKSVVACRKLASRARLAVKMERPECPVSPEQHQQLHEAFFDAARSGNLHGLEALLKESVELHSDAGGKVKTAPAGLNGREAVARFFMGIWRGNTSSRQNIHISTRWFNGRPGMLIYQGDQLVAALSFTVEQNLISNIYALRNPVKLEVFEVS